MKIRFFILITIALVLLGIAFFGDSLFDRPSPVKMAPTVQPAPFSKDPDGDLVRSLLSEKLSERTFLFVTIAEATSGKKVLPLDQSPSHLRVVKAIEQSIAQVIAELSQSDSAVQSLTRINEASKFFEDGLLAKLNAIPGLKCEVPPTRSGVHQRSGYPDLRIVDEASGGVFYLDPKLVAKGSAGSTFRTFYFEPKDDTLKITDDAVHLLIGIEHDGKPGEWNFTGWRLVDVSKLRVRLKAEFQASNADLYRETVLSLPESNR